MGMDRGRHRAGSLHVRASVALLCLALAALFAA
jgi:hypothetical protein